MTSRNQGTVSSRERTLGTRLETSLARSCYAKLCKPIRNQKPETRNQNNISRSVSTFPSKFRPFRLHGATPAETSFAAPLHRSFNLKFQRTTAALQGLLYYDNRITLCLNHCKSIRFSSYDFPRSNGERNDNQTLNVFRLCWSIPCISR